ncbi:MAG TPA: hypothetical protein VIN09_02585 [Chloroflexota bacterium]
MSRGLFSVVLPLIVVPLVLLLITALGSLLLLVGHGTANAVALAITGLVVLVAVVASRRGGSQGQQ